MKKIRYILCNEQNKYFKCGIGILCALLGLAVVVICMLHGLGEDIWYDEVFSVRFMEHGYSEIVWLTSQDVHPPLYYWYLKLIHDAGHWILPGVSSVALCKFASVLPFIGIYIYAITLVRKRLGWQVTGIFMLFLVIMPQIPVYMLEIRMYSLALFFITAIFLHGYELVLGYSSQKVWGHWTAFWVYGVLTAYTQYYACIAVVSVYIALFVFFALQKERKQLVKLGICAGLSVIVYLPWLPSFVSQVTAVSSNYWIQPLTFRSIFGCIKHVFLPVSNSVTKNYILALAMIAIFALAFIHSFIKKKEVSHRYLLLCGIFIPVFTAFMGFVCSALSRPIFVYRYLVPCLGAMWLVAVVVITDSFSKNWGVLLLVPFLLAGHSNMQAFHWEENNKVVQMEATMELLDEIPKDAVILCNFDHVQAVSAYYLPEDRPVYLYGWETEDLIMKLLPNCRHVEDVTELKALMESEDVYFFGSFNSREDLLAEWMNAGIQYTEEGTYLLERYYFNVYHLYNE